MTDAQTNDRVPAFPGGDFAGCEPSYGLTKREWMAGMIACGFMANKDRPQFFAPPDDAKYILAVTDAVLSALEKTP